MFESRDRKIERILRQRNAGSDRRSDQWGHGLEHYGGKKEMERPCFECGVMTTGRHHVVPVVSGGSRQLPLCTSCHADAHDVRLSTLTKIGHAKSSKKPGRKAISDEVKKSILALRELGVSYSVLAKGHGVSVGFVSKVVNDSGSDGTNG